jgi:hypothetical protein
MVNPISSHVSNADQAAKPSTPKPQQAQQKTAPQPSDTVTLKSAGSVNPYGDNH